MEAVQISGVDFSDFKSALDNDRKKLADEILAGRDQPTDFPADDIMKMFGWKTKKKFYKERRARKVEPSRKVGITPLYIPSHFLKVG